MSTINSVFKFLNVKDSVELQDLENIGERKYVEPISRIDKERLLKLDEPYNEKLFELIWKRYDWN